LNDSEWTMRLVGLLGEDRKEKGLYIHLLEELAFVEESIGIGKEEKQRE